MRKKTKTRTIDGLFYPWLIDMGDSEAMHRLRKNSEAVNVLTMFINYYTKANAGRDLCVTYSKAMPFMSASTFAKAKLWCCAFGFLYCREFGRLEHNPSIYDLITKWQWLSRQPQKLDRIERLLGRHARTLRIPLRKIQPRRMLGQVVEGKVRKKAMLHVIERRAIGMTNEP